MPYLPTAQTHATPLRLLPVVRSEDRVRRTPNKLGRFGAASTTTTINTNIAGTATCRPRRRSSLFVAFAGNGFPNVGGTAAPLFLQPQPADSVRDGRNVGVRGCLARGGFAAGDAVRVPVLAPRRVLRRAAGAWVAARAGAWVLGRST